MDYPDFLTIKIDRLSFKEINNQWQVVVVMTSKRNKAEWSWSGLPRFYTKKGAREAARGLAKAFELDGYEVELEL